MKNKIILKLKNNKLNGYRVEDISKIDFRDFCTGLYTQARHFPQRVLAGYVQGRQRSLKKKRHVKTHKVFLRWLLLIATIVVGCSPLRNKTETEISILGSTWEYSDSDWTYQITFIKDGKIKSTHPNDNTPENDNWQQSHHKIHFEYNNGFSKYDGKMKTLNLIVGKGNSTSGKWKWKMKRIN